MEEITYFINGLILLKNYYPKQELTIELNINSKKIFLTLELFRKLLIFFTRLFLIKVFTLIYKLLH